MTISAPARAGDRTTVRPLTADDLPAADEILRAAFNTFVGVPDLFGDADYVHTRFAAAPDAALAAEVDGALVGSNFVTRWGSFGFFGPLSIRPELWDQGVAQHLLEPTMDLLEGWSVTDAGLFTFADSAKHTALYRRYGFWPQRLTFVMAAPVGQAPPRQPPLVRLSTVTPTERRSLLEGCADVTNRILDGLDLGREIDAVASQRLGDTVVLVDDDVVGFAICHRGAGTEAGSGACYVKFGAVRPGPQADQHLGRLIDACFSYAGATGCHVLVAGSNAARVGACEALFSRGFRTQLQGVAMQRGDRPGFNRPDAHVLDDWR